MKKVFYLVVLCFAFTACSSANKTSKTAAEKKQEEKKAKPVQQELEVM
jgi:hypothetical protein